MKIEIEVKFFMKDLFFFLTPAKPNRERCLCVCSIVVADPEPGLGQSNIGGSYITISKTNEVKTTSCNITNGGGIRDELGLQIGTNVGRSVINLIMLRIHSNTLLPENKETRAIGHVHTTVQTRSSRNVLGQNRSERRESAIGLTIVNDHPANDSICRISAAKKESSVELDALEYNFSANAVVSSGALRYTVDLGDPDKSDTRLSTNRRSVVLGQTKATNSRIGHCTVEELDLLSRGSAVKTLYSSRKRTTSGRDNSSTTSSSSSKPSSIFGFGTAGRFGSRAENKARRGRSTRHVYSSIFVCLKMMTSE